MHALEIKNLVKTYSNGFQALKGISLNIKQGAFFALLGPNGAGKSTLINIITSLLPKTSGEAKVFGYDIEHEPFAAKSVLGLVPQEINLSIFQKSFDILVNQAGFYGIPRQRAVGLAEKYLRALDLWDKRFVAPNQLSGGMKRRLMIARAMVHEPKLLILDEPTAGVDIEIRQHLWKFLNKINQEGVTIVLTTHYLEEAEENCNDIALINHGQIEKQTTMQDLLKHNLDEELTLILTQPISQPINLDGWETKLIDEQTLEVTLPQDRCLNQLFTALNEKNINIKAIYNKTRRLEEIFLNLIDKNK